MCGPHDASSYGFQVIPYKLNYSDHNDEISAGHIEAPYNPIVYWRTTDPLVHLVHAGCYHLSCIIYRMRFFWYSSLLP